jgi:D-aminoacyl-tRNA deacylase
MFLISTSRKDIASMNILHHLLKLRRWKEIGTFNENEVYENGDFLIVTIDEEHLFYDNIDVKVKDEIHKEVDAVIYASRHKSAANLRTLSVHPIGNYSQAEYLNDPSTSHSEREFEEFRIQRMLRSNSPRSILEDANIFH